MPSLDSPSPVAPQLPDNHPVHGLDNAKRLFKDRLPPFVHKGPFGLRRRVIIAQWKDRHRSESEVVHRRWDRWNSMTTIDLGGQRSIVRAFRNAGGGFRYHYWDAYLQDFATYPVAFSWPGEVANRLEALRETYEAGSGLQSVEHVHISQTQLPGPSQAMLQNQSTNTGAENDVPNQRTVATLPDADELSSMCSQRRPPPKEIPSLGTSPKSSMTFEQQNTEQYTASESSRGLIPPCFNDPWALTTLERPANTSLPQEKSPCGFMPTSGVSKAAADDHATNPQQPEKLSHGEKRPLEPASFDASCKRHQQDYTRSSSEVQNSVNLNATPSYPSPGPSLGSQGSLEKLTSTLVQPSQLPDTVEAPLSPHKQRSTTLRIILPFSSDFVPLRLGSCVTTESLFESATLISGSKMQGHTVSGLRVTFDWKGKEDVNRAMFLKQEYPESFEIFLETVSQAPCWESDGGRCSVGVEVVLE